MAVKQLTEGDTVGLTGEVTMVHDDGTVTIHLHGYVYPLTLGARKGSLATLPRVSCPHPPSRQFLGSP